MKLFLLIIGGALLLSACSSPNEEQQESPNEAISKVLAAELEANLISEEPPKEGLRSSRYHYDEDFEVFKIAVINKDIQAVSAFATSDVIDAEMLIEAFNDPDFLTLLKAATYDDLTTDTNGEEILLVFSATIQGDAGNGEVFESGLYLYFSHGDNGLMLENFLAAG